MNIAESVPVDIAVLANDTDPDGDSLTVTSITTDLGDPSATFHASVTINPDGTIRYIPRPVKISQDGTPLYMPFCTDSFTYTISDGNGGIHTARVTVRWDSQDFPPGPLQDILLNPNLGLSSIIFWERTIGRDQQEGYGNLPKPFEFPTSNPILMGKLTARLSTLAPPPNVVEDYRGTYCVFGEDSPNCDFEGVDDRELYDVFFSNADGSPNPDGEFITIEAVWNKDWANDEAGGGLNLAEVQLNFANGKTRCADFVESSVPLGDNSFLALNDESHSDQKAADGQRWTVTIMGNTKNQPQRLRVTVGFQHQPPDTDGDGIGDDRDNCPNTFNPNQADTDGDGIGDVCDNCPNVSNTGQSDTDDDGIGNGCDNCMNVANPDQADSDEDNIGNACEPDTDGDGLIDDIDNCPRIANPDQADLDGDGIGDVCDNCSAVVNTGQKDTDGDGLGNACDNCPGVSNPSVK